MCFEWLQSRQKHTTFWCRRARVKRWVFHVCAKDWHSQKFPMDFSVTFNTIGQVIHHVSANWLFQLTFEAPWCAKKKKRSPWRRFLYWHHCTTGVILQVSHHPTKVYCYCKTSHFKARTFASYTFQSENEVKAKCCLLQVSNIMIKQQFINSY